MRRQRQPVIFQGPMTTSFPLDGGLDLVSSHIAKKPGSLIAGYNIEMVTGKQGYSRPGGFDRCITDDLPSNTRVTFFKIKTPTGTGISVDDKFISSTKTFYSLDAVSSPQAGDIIAVATHSTGFIADMICTGPTAGFTIDEEVTDTSIHTTAELQGYIRQAIEQTRSNVPEVTGTGQINGGFRLRGKNYVFREGVLCRGDAAGWTAIEMPDVMYFDEGVSEIYAGDEITDGTATATVSSITRQSGAWNYTLDPVDQAAGYLTLDDVSGTFTANQPLLVGETVPNIVNGTFTGDTDWTKGVGWTIPGTNVASSDGSQIAVSDLSQAFTLATGRSVSLTYALTISAGSITPFLGATVGTAVTTAGAKTVTLERTTGSNIIGFRASEDFIGTIDNVVRIVSIDTVPAITNGAFGADTGWTKGTGWTIAAGKATCSGTQAATTELSQAYTISEGRSVVITFTVSGLSAQTVTPFLGASDGTPVSADGTYVVTLGRTTGDNIIGFRGSADFVGSIDDVSTAAGRRANVTTANSLYVLPIGGSYETTSYNFTKLVDGESIFGVSGVGEAFEFDGTNYIPIFIPDAAIEFPTLVKVHQERLQLAFPGGQLIYSVSGQPRVYNALLGSGVHSTSSEIVGLKKIHGNAEAVFCESSVWLLIGTGIYNETTATRDWNFIEHSDYVGAVAGSVADRGPVLYVGGNQLMTVSSTDTSAGYSSAPLLQKAQPYLAGNADTVVCALWCEKKSQYRLFFEAGLAMYTTFWAGAPRGATPMAFPIQIVHAWSATEDSVEYLFFVSTTGFLYRMDTGNSFDDDYIEGSFRVPFYNYGNSRQEKSFPQMIIELDSPIILAGDTEIAYTVNHAYGDIGWPRPVVERITSLNPMGGLYGANAGFGLFVWGGVIVSQIIGYIDGYGPNMSILVTYKTKHDNPFAFLSATVDYIGHGLAGQET